MMQAAAFNLEHALDCYPRFASCDLGEVRQQGARLFCEHRLLLSGGAGRLDARAYYRSLGGIGLGRLRYGAAVDIDPGALQSFYLLQVPLRGHEIVVCDGCEIRSDSACASLVHPAQRMHMHHGADTHKLFVRIDAASFDALARLENDGSNCALRNRLLWFDISTQGLRRMLQWLFEEASCGSLLDLADVAAQAERCLMLALLQAAMPLRDAPCDRVIRPGFVHRALELMQARAQEPLSVGDIAAEVGVSARTLYAGFRQYVGVTPLAHLKALRLDHAHAELGQARERDESVSDVALRWGFFHLGQFAADYRRRFGQRPSQTRAAGMRLGA